jgi:hypothetical protein
LKISRSFRANLRSGLRDELISATKGAIASGGDSSRSGRDRHSQTPGEKLSVLLELPAASIRVNETENVPMLTDPGE